MSQVWLQNKLMALTDAIYAHIPRPRPTSSDLQNVRVIAHRGVHGAAGPAENSMAAFEAACRPGIWSIEFDIRWTLDLEPVVIHDARTSRLFGKDLVIAETSWQVLHARIPEIPHFRDVLSRFKTRTHFMIEVKCRPHLPSPAAIESFRRELKDFEPVRDFHVMSLRPELFALFPDWPKRTFVPVAEWNGARIGPQALREGWAAFTGQYLLTPNARVRAHLAKGQTVGTGFIDSKNLLHRELRRGVRWLFSNRADRVAAWLEELRQ